jgi:SAC3/GANP family
VLDQLFMMGHTLHTEAISLTAAGLDENPGIQQMGIGVYEAAADAALLSGSLGFYLSCQSRLLRDLYPLEKARLGKAPARAIEFLALSILFFSAFSTDAIELACLLREMTLEASSSPEVRFSLNVAVSLASADCVEFFRLYHRGNRRQRTIMHPAVERCRSTAIIMMSRTYRSLDVSTIAKWLYITDEGQVRALLLENRPDLESVNPDTCATSLCFVQKKSTRVC